MVENSSATSRIDNFQQRALAPLQSNLDAVLAPPFISIHEASHVLKRTRRELPRSNSAQRRKRADKFGSVQYRSHDELMLG